MTKPPTFVFDLKRSLAEIVGIRVANYELEDEDLVPPPPFLFDFKRSLSEIYGITDVKSEWIEVDDSITGTEPSGVWPKTVVDHPFEPLLTLLPFKTPEHEFESPEVEAVDDSIVSSIYEYESMEVDDSMNVAIQHADSRPTSESDSALTLTPMKLRSPESPEGVLEQKKPPTYGHSDSKILVVNSPVTKLDINLDPDEPSGVLPTTVDHPIGSLKTLLPFKTPGREQETPEVEVLDDSIPSSVFDYGSMEDDSTAVTIQHADVTLLSDSDLILTPMKLRSPESLESVLERQKKTPTYSHSDSKILAVNSPITKLDITLDPIEPSGVLPKPIEHPFGPLKTVFSFKTPGRVHETPEAEVVNDSIPTSVFEGDESVFFADVSNVTLITKRLPGVENSMSERVAREQSSVCLNSSELRSLNEKSHAESSMLRTSMIAIITKSNNKIKANWLHYSKKTKKSKKKSVSMEAPEKLEALPRAKTTTPRKRKSMAVSRHLSATDMFSTGTPLPKPTAKRKLKEQEAKPPNSTVPKPGMFSTGTPLPEPAVKRMLIEQEAKPPSSTLPKSGMFDLRSPHSRRSGVVKPDPPKDQALGRSEVKVENSVLRRSTRNRVPVMKKYLGQHVVYEYDENGLPTMKKVTDIKKERRNSKRGSKKYE